MQLIQGSNPGLANSVSKSGSCHLDFRDLVSMISCCNMTEVLFELCKILKTTLNLSYLVGTDASENEDLLEYIYVVLTLSGRMHRRIRIFWNISMLFQSPGNG